MVVWCPVIAMIQKTETHTHKHHIEEKKINIKPLYLWSFHMSGYEIFFALKFWGENWKQSEKIGLNEENLPVHKQQQQQQFQHINLFGSH